MSASAQSDESAATAGTAETTPALSTAATERPATLSQLRPCELLGPQQVALYGYTNTQSFDDEDPRTCSYSAQDSNRQLIITFTAAGIRTVHPHEDAVVLRYPIGAHQAVRARSTRRAMCTVYMAINDRTMVTVQTLGQRSSDAACSHAGDVATTIEPLLP
jgi:hypothetical protein